MSKENKQDLEEEGLPKELVAFSSGKAFKDVISTQEFESVIKVLMYSYDKILDIMNTREESKAEAKKKLKNFREALNPSNEDFSKAVKIAKKMVKETDKKIIEKFGIEVSAIEDITNFLNRFRASNQILDQIDVSPLTNKTQI